MTEPTTKQTKLFSSQTTPVILVDYQHHSRGTKHNTTLELAEGWTRLNRLTAEGPRTPSPVVLSANLVEDRGSPFTSRITVCSPITSPTVSPSAGQNKCHVAIGQPNHPRFNLQFSLSAIQATCGFNVDGQSNHVQLTIDRSNNLQFHV